MDGLRAKGVEVTEEHADAADLDWLEYALPPERYLPVVKIDNRSHFKFEMPAMCAICGSPDARQHREIGCGSSGTTQDPSRGYDDKLSHLTAPVCKKHSEAEAPSGDVLEYRSGKLMFASYRYYKAFCELNQIGGAKPPVTG